MLVLKMSKNALLRNVDDYDDMNKKEFFKTILKNVISRKVSAMTFFW